MPALGTIDLSEVLSDPDLCQTFTISRSNGNFVAGGWSEVRQELTAYGIITIASDKALKMIPEADRVQGSLSFFTVTPLFVTHTSRSAICVNTPPGTSDILIWRCQQYRIMSISPQWDFGYNSALAVRLAGQ